MKKLSLFVLASVLVFQFSIAQKTTITGSVKNEEGMPVSYAFIMDKGEKTGVYADSLGSFSLSAQSNSSLLISSKGYADVLVQVDKKTTTNLQIVLKHSNAPAKDDNTRTGNSSIDNAANDAFTGHTNMSSTYNASNATEGGEAKFNGSSFPITREKEETHGSRFLFNNWLSGYVINAKDVEVKNPAFLFKYDKIRGVLILTHDQKSAIEIDKDQIKSFTLYDQQEVPYVFERLPAIDDIHFMQVLVAGSKYKIYKLTTSKFVRADPNTNGLVSTGNTYDEYVDENTYYVLTVKTNDVKKLSLKKKSIKEIFGSEGDKLNNFFSSHSSDTIDDDFLKNLGNSMNN